MAVIEKQPNQNTFIAEAVARATGWDGRRAEAMTGHARTL